MSTMDRIRAGIVVVAAVACAVSVAATAERSERVENAAIMAPEVAQPDDRTPGKVPETRPREKGRTIRCWQYGRLILEEAVAETSGVSGQTYHLKRPNDPQGMQLIDLRSGGVCLIG